MKTNFFKPARVIRRQARGGVQLRAIVSRLWAALPGAVAIAVAMVVLHSAVAAPPATSAKNAAKVKSAAVAKKTANTKTAAPAKNKAKPDPETKFHGEVLPWLKKNCLECHGEDAQEGDIRFDTFKDTAAVAADQKTWQRAIEMLRSGAMPPEDSPQPSEAERQKLVHWIEQTIYHFDCDAGVDPGRVTIRRLNRAEYNNTVRDLVGVAFRPADDFPSDDVGGGFDNIGDVLTLPPLLMEKYLAAAERIAEDVIVTDPSVFVKSQFRFRDQLKGDGGARYDESRSSRRWTIRSSGSVYYNFEFPRSGRYTLRATAMARPKGDNPPRMEMRLDGKSVNVFDVTASDSRGRYEIKATVEAGTHRLSVHLLDDSLDAANRESRRGEGNLVIDSMEIDGPLEPRLEDYPEAHRRLITALPGEGVSIAAAAGTNLQPLLLRAFRRPPSKVELARFVKIVETAVKEGDSFEQGMQVALTAVLVSPNFLFRAEGGPKASEANIVRPLNDYELASRLSYFLWSSMPDAELLKLAAAGKLHEEAVLERQVRRMLADAKSESLVQNFFAQWLNLRLLDGVTPDPQIFPAFDAQLKAAMRRETELFAAEIVRQDQSVLDFLTGRYTFVNERLARHYGIEGVRGDEFRKVALAGNRRSGVLTHASILTLTSNPGRTSPVKRGKWLLENILGSPPPDPPPDAPTLDTVQKSRPNATLREQLTIHREDPVCASCHKVMDQLGFGLENFDAIGSWREKDAGQPIDSSGELPGGAKFNGPVAMAKVLNKRRAEFVRCLSEKLLTFALGRELVVPDRCAVEKIVAEVKNHDFRFSALVMAIVRSDPFYKTRGEGDEP